MVAVVPHLEESLTESIKGPERVVFRLSSVSSGLRAADEEKAGRVIDPTALPAQALDKNHQQLVRGLMLRDIAGRLLDGRELRVAFDAKGEAKVYIEPPILRDEQPTWATYVNDIGDYPFLTWTKKMQCPSFSLPAGARDNGGSCPAAGHGQSTVPKDKLFELRAKQRILDMTIGRGSRLEERDLAAFYALSVCETCYAEVLGSYQYFNNVVGQLAVFAWTQEAVKGGYFVRTMIEVIERADYHLDPEDTEGGSPVADLEHLSGTPWKRYFRWHDSGDIWSEEYARQIKQICDHFNPRKGGTGTPTLFWMPTRAWASRGSAGWTRVNDDPLTNLVIRPSAFHVNSPAPTRDVAGPGNQAGSTVYSGKIAEQARARGMFDFDCPAATNKKTCREARCRACWMHPEAIINYRLH